MVSLGFGSCNLRAVLTGGDVGQAPVCAVCCASGLFRAPPFSLTDETRTIDKKHIRVGESAPREISHLVVHVFARRGNLGKKAHGVGQMSGISLVKYREWMGVNRVVRKV